MVHVQGSPNFTKSTQQVCAKKLGKIVYSELGYRGLIGMMLKNKPQYYMQASYFFLNNNVGNTYTSALDNIELSINV